MPNKIICFYDDTPIIFAIEIFPVRYKYRMGFNGNPHKLFYFDLSRIPLEMISAFNTLGDGELQRVKFEYLLEICDKYLLEYEIEK